MLYLLLIELLILQHLLISSVDARFSMALKKRRKEGQCVFVEAGKFLF
jgi:hypothetical protein